MPQLFLDGRGAQRSHAACHNIADKADEDHGGGDPDEGKRDGSVDAPDGQRLQKTRDGFHQDNVRGKRDPLEHDVCGNGFSGLADEGDQSFLDHDGKYLPYNM